jgi:hypothetical protein
MAAEDGLESVDDSLVLIRTHPLSPERFVILQQTQKEIEDKIRKKEPLMPNLWRGYDYGKKFWWWENDDDADEPDEDMLNH